MQQNASNDEQVPDPFRVLEDTPLPTERLEAEICTLAGHITAATCQFLIYLGEFDARGGWAAWEMPSCAAWLSWKCQIASGTAREHVRVAAALRHLPVIRTQFAAGRMSFSKVRALTRIATPVSDKDLAAMAGPMTANQLERFARAYHQCTEREAWDRERLPQRAPRKSLRWRFDLDTGGLTFTVQLPPGQGAVLLQALRAALDDLEHPHDDQDDHDTPPPVTAGQRPDEFKADTQDLADALTEVAASYLRGKIASADNADIYQVVIHTTPQALTTPPGQQPEDVSAQTPGTAGRLTPEVTIGHPAWPGRCHVEDGPALSPLTAQLIACDATISAMAHDLATGDVLTIGRRSRRATAAIRRAVRERDGYRCTFPGCDSRRTDLHHIIWWSNGGPTSVGNLQLLCKRHHAIVHDTGYIITRRPGGGYTFTRPDGPGPRPAPAAARPRRRHHRHPPGRHRPRHHPAAPRRTTRPAPGHLDRPQQRTRPRLARTRPGRLTQQRPTGRRPA